MTTCDKDGCGKEVDNGTGDYRIAASGNPEEEDSKIVFRASGPFKACVSKGKPLEASSAGALLTKLGVPKTAQATAVQVLEDLLEDGDMIITHSEVHLLDELGVAKTSRSAALTALKDTRAGAA